MELIPDDVHARLEQERAELLGQLEEVECAVLGLRDARSGADGDDEHDPEGAPLSQQWSHGQALAASLRQRLADNAAAAARVAEGSYGTCARCGRPISHGRLAARPSATLCIDCAAR